MSIAVDQLRDREEDYININPLQTGGKTYPETRKAITAYVDGYSICDWCKGDLCSIEKPPVKYFLQEASEFLGMDETLITNGCREAKNIVFHALTEASDAIVVDGNKHYSTVVAAEQANIEIYEVESSGPPQYTIKPESYAEKIEEVEKKTGKRPKICVLTHVDGSYGNVVDAKKVSKISHEYEIPMLLNTAYSSGRMKIDGSKLGCDFIACSGHKSWSAGGGNIGLLSVKSEYAKKVFSKSLRHENKTLAILGCSARGSSTIALMASFPKVRERVKRWEKEVENSRNLLKELESIGLIQLGEKPTNHDLNFIESNTLYEISKKHKKKNYYLYSELKKRGITGIKAGLTKHFKFSTYGKTDEQIKHLAWAFKDIVEKFG